MEEDHPIKLSTTVCSEFLKLTPQDYLARLDKLSKQDQKEYKRNICLQFTSFCGIFQVDSSYNIVTIVSLSSNEYD